MRNIYIYIEFLKYITKQKLANLNKVKIICAAAYRAVRLVVHRPVQTGTMEDMAIPRVDTTVSPVFVQTDCALKVLGSLCGFKRKRKHRFYCRYRVLAAQNWATSWCMTRKRPTGEFRCRY